MGTNAIDIRIFASPEEAPNYESPEYTLVDLSTAAVVGNGTVNGNPTVDLVFVAPDGKKYIAMATNALLEGVMRAARGLQHRHEG